MLGLLFQFRNFLVAALLMLLSLWFSGRSPDQRLRIANGLEVTLFSPIQYVLQKILWLESTLETNRRLLDENARMQNELLLLKESGNENQKLRQMIGFKENSPYTLVPAEVVAQTISPMAKNIVIAAGSRDGVKKDMPVISLEGVVGKVAECYPFHANVQLVNDPHSKTSVYFSRSHIVGILECKSGVFPVVRIPNHGDILPGDTVLTSGLGGIFPKGFFVGVVDTVFPGDELLKTVRIKTDLGTRHIGHAFVIKLETQWQSFSSGNANELP